MFKLLGKLCCVLTMISLINGFSIIFQSYAWSTMLRDRVPEQGLEQALESTFSGNAPCPLCIALEEAKIEKQKNEQNDSKIAEASPSAKLIPCLFEDIKIYRPLATFTPYHPSLMLHPASIYIGINTPPPDSFS